MIRINRQTDYAIRLVLFLAQQEKGARVSTAEARTQMKIPPAIAQRIVADLARGAFILTFQGRDGGLSLARPAEEINLRQVIEHFEGNFMLSDCLSDTGNCPFENHCPVQFRWARLQSQMVRELERVTFRELAEEASSISKLLSTSNGTHSTHQENRGGFPKIE